MRMKSNKEESIIKHFSTYAVIAVAAVLILSPIIKTLIDPQKPTTQMLSNFRNTDSFNQRLNQLQHLLSPVEQYLTEDATLLFIGNEDLFPYMQAVLAPRRISSHIDSNFLLIHAAEGEFLRNKAEGASLVVLLSRDLGLFRKVAP